MSSFAATHHSPRTTRYSSNISHVGHILGGHEPGFNRLDAQMPFALAGLMAVEMLFASLASFKLPVGRHAKTLARGFMRFLLGHKFINPWHILESEMQILDFRMRISRP